MFEDYKKREHSTIGTIIHASTAISGAFLYKVGYSDSSIFFIISITASIISYLNWFKVDMAIYYCSDLSADNASIKKWEYKKKIAQIILFSSILLSFSASVMGLFFSFVINLGEFFVYEIWKFFIFFELFFAIAVWSVFDFLSIIKLEGESTKRVL